MSKSKSTIICTSCGVSYNRHNDSKGLYCSYICQQQKQYENRIHAWLKGELVGLSKNKTVTPWVKRYLLDIADNKCSKCGFIGFKERSGLTVLEADHIDGNADNNRPENLRILCPNCHAMTPTYRGHNTGKSSRTLR